MAFRSGRLALLATDRETPVRAEPTRDTTTFVVSGSGGAT